MVQLKLLHPIKLNIADADSQVKLKAENVSLVIVNVIPRDGEL